MNIIAPAPADANATTCIDLKPIVADDYVTWYSNYGHHTRTGTVMAVLTMGGDDLAKVQPDATANGTPGLAEIVDLSKLTLTDRPIAANDRVTWTSKRNGVTYTGTGTVEAIETWTGSQRARVDTDTTGAHKVTTVVDVAGLARIATPRIPAQRTTGGAA